MRQFVCTFMFAALAVTSLAAQQVPPPPQAVVPILPGQAPQTPPPGRPTQPPTTRPEATLPVPAQPPRILIPVQPSGRDGRTWQNVGVEVTITDSVTAEVTTKKTVNLFVLDGESGQVRSVGAGTINVDVIPSIRPDGRIFLRMTLEYLPDLSGQQEKIQNVSRTSFHQSLALLVVPDGKPMMASQTSDPRSDRKVMVQITAIVGK